MTVPVMSSLSPPMTSIRIVAGEHRPEQPVADCGFDVDQSQSDFLAHVALGPHDEVVERHLVEAVFGDYIVHHLNLRGFVSGQPVQETGHRQEGEDHQRNGQSHGTRAGLREHLHSAFL